MANKRGPRLYKKKHGGHSYGSGDVKDVSGPGLTGLK